MFRIGEFSRLAQLSVRVLRHYDEIGLLRPAGIDPANGYRRYSAEQLAQVNRIIALKDLGLSLERVQTLMGEQLSTEELVGILRMEIARAEQARADAERRLRDLRHRLAEVSDTGSLSEVNIVERSMPAVALLACRTMVPDLAAVDALAAELLAARAGLGRTEPLIVVAHDRFFDTENLDLELGLPISEPPELTLESGRRLATCHLPAVERMLSITCLGSQDEVHRRCHHALAAWLSRHRCHLAGPGREIIHDSGRDGRPTSVVVHRRC